ncbi:MAG: hypothetical protein U0361_05865 [Nitrospiraceae bacterium]
MDGPSFPADLAGPLLALPLGHGLASLLIVGGATCRVGSTARADGLDFEPDRQYDRCRRAARAAALQAVLDGEQHEG